MAAHTAQRANHRKLLVLGILGAVYMVRFPSYYRLVLDTCKAENISPELARQKASGAQFRDVKLKDSDLTAEGDSRLTGWPYLQSLFFRRHRQDAFRLRSPPSDLRIGGIRNGKADHPSFPRPSMQRLFQLFSFQHGQSLCSSQPRVAAITALMVCIRFSASSKTTEASDSNTSSVTSIS